MTLLFAFSRYPAPISRACAVLSSYRKPQYVLVSFSTNDMLTVPPRKSVETVKTTAQCAADIASTLTDEVESNAKHREDASEVFS